MNIFQMLNPFFAASLLYKNRDLIIRFTSRTLKSRYKGSVLGYVWSFVQPLMMLLVYTFVFGFVFKAKWGISVSDDTSSFSIIMFCGMAIYTLFAESLNNCSSIILANSNLVKKVIFPLEILPIVQVSVSFILGIVWLIFVLIGSLFIFKTIHITLFWLPVIIIPFFAFVSGVSLFIASLGVYIRDTSYIVGIITQIFLFMTPIFYPISSVPEGFTWILYSNPLTFFVEQTRSVMLFGQSPDPVVCVLLWIGSLLIFQLGFAWFMKTKKGFADVL